MSLYNENSLGIAGFIKGLHKRAAAVENIQLFEVKGDNC